MVKKKNTGIRKKAADAGKIYVSPDGGHTVYEQNRDGTRGTLVSQDQHAVMLAELQDDAEMFGFEAYELRKTYPTLKKAYDNYKTIWHMVKERDDSDQI